MIYNVMAKLKNFASKRLTILIIISVILGLAFPKFWLNVGAHIKVGKLTSVSVILGFVMLCMGTTLRAEDVKYVVSHPLVTVSGILMQYLIMPFSAYLIARLFQLSPEMSFGLIMLGCVPGGIASNVFTYVARGDVALSVAITMCTTLLSPLLTPALVLLLGGAYVKLSFSAMAMQIVNIVLAPIIIGAVLRALFADFIMKVADGISFLSIVAVNIVLAIVVAGCAKAILSITIIPVFIAVFVHFIVAFAIAWLISTKVLKLSEKRTIALSLEIPIQNSGLAATLSNNVAVEQVKTGVRTSMAGFAVPCTVGSIVDQVMAALIASYYISKDEKRIAAEKVSAAAQ